MINLKPKVVQIKDLDKLIGHTLPDTSTGTAGQGLEQLISDTFGVEFTREPGADFKEYNLEVKSRDIDSSAHHTIGTMSLTKILSTAYDDSHIKEKLQQQLRVYTKDNVIIKADLYDFSPDYIQDLIRESYEGARNALIARNMKNAGNFGMYETISGGQFGSFEHKGNGSFSFRISDAGMKKLKFSSTSLFGKLWEPA